ncbi:MAG: glycosyltransferase family 2 protein [Candidatus Levyibacteriota bacterium]
MTKVFVTLINYNSNQATSDCLHSLEEINTADFVLSVVVIDNASTEKFTKDKKYQKLNLKIIRSEKNLGFAGGQNLGIKFALDNGADYVVVLNDDVILDKDLIVELLKTFETNKDCGMVSPKIYFAKGYEFHKDRYQQNELGKVIWYAGGKIDWQNVIASHRGVDEVDKGQYEKVAETDFASGCCEMIKRKVLEKIGLFDERYFLYYEDNDLSQRAKAYNFKILYQPKAIMWHLNAGSTGGSGSTLHDYYITRNRLLFGFKYSSLRTKLALSKESFRDILSGRPWQKKGALDFYLRKFGKGSYHE